MRLVGAFCWWSTELSNVNTHRVRTVFQKLKEIRMQIFTNIHRQVLTSVDNTRKSSAEMGNIYIHIYMCVCVCVCTYVCM